VAEPSLNPTLVTRIAVWLRPDWTRTVAFRRVAAAVLVVLAGVATLRSNPDDDRADVVVAARDLPPGTALASDDVRLETRSATTVPDGSRTELSAVVGSTLASPTRRGEVLTDVRLLGSRLAELTAGPGARIVPLHLADSALIDLIRVGDVVDVLAAPANDAPGAAPASSKAAATLLATDAVVVLVSAKEKAQSAGGDRVVLVALPARLANTVAGSALGQTVTLILH
jgi:Flp pilus assembly protein CpaB